MSSIPPQRTLASVVTFSGVGLHSGVDVNMTLEPGDEKTGFVFIRDDLEGKPEIPVDRHHVVPTNRGTLLRQGGVEVHTVEHVLAAAAGLGIDNLRIILDAGEPPALDGSAREVGDAILSAGMAEQEATQRTYRVLFPISFQSQGACITAVPADEFRISSTIEYPGTAIGCQSMSVTVTPDLFRDEIMRARTFCLRQEVEQLRAAGLGLGGSLENAVVVDGDEVLNEDLRFGDEFVRHKILDVVGDLAIAGARIRGHFIAHKTGHFHNAHLLKKLFSEGALGALGPYPPVPLDTRAISRILPHRYPFLLIDRIDELEIGKRAVGYKAVTINEPFFRGHFPGRPVMPGVLIMEALAQVAGVTMLSRPEFQGKTPFFTGLDRVAFRHPIYPGDHVRLEIEIDRIKMSMGRAKGRALVDGQVAAEGILKFTLIE